jgi:hypothetical protein
MTKAGLPPGLRSKGESSRAKRSSNPSGGQYGTHKARCEGSAVSELPAVRFELAPYLNELARKLELTNPGPLLEWIKQIPIERRYISRIVAALRVAFQDFDAYTVAIDADTLSAEEVKEIVEELTKRERQLGKTLEELKRRLPS